MSGEINKIRSERRKAFRQVKATLRLVDSGVERAQRLLTQKIQMKRNIISLSDYQKLLNIIIATDKALDGVLKEIEMISGVFTI